VVSPSDTAISISSARGESTRGNKSQDQALASQQEREPVLQQVETVPIANGTKKSTRSVNRTVPQKATTGTLAALVTEAEALKDELRQAYTRTHRLLAAIKKHRRQNKLVQSTLATLRQLKNVAG
jgi:hypothetical protein